MKLEVRTVAAMIRLYCRAHHGTDAGLCSECAELSAYARSRITLCPFGMNKPVCNRCQVHCYRPEQREKIREVMRYAGPRMLWRHPLLAIRHLVRSRKENGT